MTTATTTLTDFLLAQIAADEEVARAAIEDDGGYDEGFACQYDALRQPPSGIGIASGGFGDAAARMIATYAVPRRVLAQCAAYRAIVEIHETNVFPEGQEGTWCEQCSDDTAYGEPFPCPTIRALVGIYADREGFREEWRA